MLLRLFNGRVIDLTLIENLGLKNNVILNWKIDIKISQIFLKVE